MRGKTALVQVVSPFAVFMFSPVMLALESLVRMHPGVYFFVFNFLGLTQLLESVGLCLLPNLGSFQPFLSLSTFPIGLFPLLPKLG